MKPFDRTLLATIALATACLLTSCDRPGSAAEKAALEKEVAELQRQNAEMQRRVAEEELARVKEQLEAERAGGTREREAIEAERADLARQRAAMQAALETSAPKAVIVEEEPEAAKLAIEIEDVPAEELLRSSHDQLAEIAGRMAIEIADKVAKKNARNRSGRIEPKPLPAIPAAEEDYGVFYANLQHFGTWFQTTDYGYAWQPAVVRTDPRWRPYTRGHWIYSDQGWLWASDEPFGWATYHYGRWAMLDRVGWVWIPGEQWAPAWVSWRRSDDYIGWAPLPPETLYNHESVYDTRVDHRYGMSMDWYTFVPARSFGEPVRPVCLPPEDGLRIARTTTNVTGVFLRNERVHVSGIDYKWVSSRRGSAAPTCQLVRIDHRNRGQQPPGNHLRGQRMEVWAPQVTAPWNAAVRPGTVSRNLGRVSVVRSGGEIELPALERYYEEALRRREIAREVAASEPGHHALMRRQVALTRAQEQTRQAGRLYQEECEHEARERGSHAGPRHEQERLAAEAARLGEERRRREEAERLENERRREAETARAQREEMQRRALREEQARQARLEEARQAAIARQRLEEEQREAARRAREAAEEQMRRKNKGANARQAEIARQQAEEAERLAKLQAMEEDAKRLRDRAQRPGQVEQARRAKMELEKAREAQRQADLRERQEQARREEAERLKAEEAKSQAQLEARQEQARRSEMDRRKAEEAKRQADLKARQEQTRRAEMERRQAAEDAKRQAELKAQADAARRAAAERQKLEEARRQAAMKAREKKVPERSKVPARDWDAEITAAQAEVTRLKKRAQRPGQVAAAERAEAALQKLLEAKRQADLDAKSAPKTPPARNQPPSRTKP